MNELLLFYFFACAKCSKQAQCVWMEWHSDAACSSLTLCLGYYLCVSVGFLWLLSFLPNNMKFGG